jgi:hypothetical protein
MTNPFGADGGAAQTAPGNAAKAITAAHHLNPILVQNFFI